MYHASAVLWNICNAELCFLGANQKKCYLTNLGIVQHVLTFFGTRNSHGTTFQGCPCVGLAPWTFWAGSALIALPTILGKATGWNDFLPVKRWFMGGLVPRIHSFLTQINPFLLGDWRGSPTRPRNSDGFWLYICNGKTFDWNGFCFFFVCLGE